MAADCRWRVKKSPNHFKPLSLFRFGTVWAKRELLQKSEARCFIQSIKSKVGGSIGRVGKILGDIRFT